MSKIEIYNKTKRFISLLIFITISLSCLTNKAFAENSQIINFKVTSSTQTLDNLYGFAFDLINGSKIRTIDVSNGNANFELYDKINFLIISKSPNLTELKESRFFIINVSNSNEIEIENATPIGSSNLIVKFSNQNLSSDASINNDKLVQLNSQLGIVENCPSAGTDYISAISALQKASETLEFRYLSLIETLKIKIQEISSYSEGINIKNLENANLQLGVNLVNALRIKLISGNSLVPKIEIKDKSSFLQDHKYDLDCQAIVAIYATSVASNAANSLQAMSNLAVLLISIKTKLIELNNSQAQNTTLSPFIGSPPPPPLSLVNQSKKKIEISKNASISTKVKKVSITCRQGKIVKKITSTNPKCPTGFKKIA